MAWQKVAIAEGLVKGICFVMPFFVWSGLNLSAAGEAKALRLSLHADGIGALGLQ